MNNTVEQFLDQLLSLVLDVRADHAAMQAVLRSIAETHPDRPALLARLAHHQQFVRDVVEGQPLTDEQIEARHAAIERWIEWIGQAP